MATVLLSSDGSNVFSEVFSVQANAREETGDIRVNTTVKKFKMKKLKTGRETELQRGDKQV